MLAKLTQRLENKLEFSEAIQTFNGIQLNINQIKAGTISLMKVISMETVAGVIRKHHLRMAIMDGAITLRKNRIIHGELLKQIHGVAIMKMT